MLKRLTFLFFVCLFLASCGGGGGSSSDIPSLPPNEPLVVLERLCPSQDPVRLKVGQEQIFSVTPIVDGGYEWILQYKSGAPESLGITQEIRWRPEIAGNFKIICNDIVISNAVVDDPEDPNIVVEPPDPVDDPEDPNIVVEPPDPVDDPEDPNIVVEPPDPVDDPEDPNIVVDVEDPASWYCPEGDLQGTRTSNFSGPTLGMESWKIALDSFKPSGAVVDSEGNIFINTLTGIYKINPGGSTIWTFAPAGFSKFSCPFYQEFYQDGKIYFGAISESLGAIVFAINEDGQEIWRSKNINWFEDEPTADIFVGSPTLIDNSIFVYSADEHSRAGGIVKLDLKGNILRSQGNPTGFNTGSNSFVYTSSELIKFSYYPTINSTQARLWKMGTDSLSSSMNKSISVSSNGYAHAPIYANDRIIVGTSITLAVANNTWVSSGPGDTSTPILWTKSASVGQFIVFEDIIYVFEKGRGLVGRNLSDGEEKTGLSNGSITSALSMALDKDGNLFVLTYDSVVKLDKNLSVLWSVSVPDQSADTERFGSLTLGSDVAYAVIPSGIIAIR